MKINIGAPVQCRDERVGTVKRLIVEPSSFELRELVVARSGLLTAREILVPVEGIDKIKKDVVVLDMSAAELDALHDFKETVYVSLDRLPPDANAPNSTAPIEPALMSHYFIPQTPIPPIAPTVVRETVKHLEPDEREIRAGMEVYAGEHKVGGVSKVIIDDSDKRATSLIISRGWLLTHTIQVPASWIVSIEGDRILLNRTKEQIDEIDKEQNAAGPR